MRPSPRRPADMKRVVVTGLGVVSSIGNNVVEVTRSLRDGKSGIEFIPQYRELGFRSQVAGTRNWSRRAMRTTCSRCVSSLGTR